MNAEVLHGLLLQAGAQGIRRTGEGFACICPLHRGARPTFNINVDTGLWLCWNPDCTTISGLPASGNFVTFLIHVVHMPYDEAQEYAKAIPLQAEDLFATPDRWKLPEWERRHGGQEEVETRPEAILGLYDRCPTYMLTRGFTKPELRDWDIGWDEKGYPDPKHPERILGARRVTFPVRNLRGQLVGFTRRSVNPADDAFAKYIHDFEKTKVLYGGHLLNLTARPFIMGVTEGTIDVMMAKKRGLEIPARALEYEALRNMTGTLGGGLSDDQAAIVAKLFPDVVVLAFDRDAAGLSATRKSIIKLRERGLANIQVMTFPCHDLGELASDQLVDLTVEPSAAWLFKQGARHKA